MLALSFPTHGFTAPFHLLRFVATLPRRAGTHAVVVPTRAGSKVGSVYLPGLEGTGGYLVALILALKGFALRGVMAVDMPSNWTALHPSFGPEAVQSIVARGEEKTRQFAAGVLAGQPHFGGQIPLVLGLLLLPISFAYFFMGRLFLAKLFFASERCNGCGLCEQSCPVGAIRMWGTRKPRPYWTYDCESCMRCMNVCPTQAIEAGQSFAVLLYFVTAVPAASYLLGWLTRGVPVLAPLDHPWIVWLLQFAYTIVAIFLAYVAFTWLIRIPLVNRLFAYTTLTRWYRRYHEPATRLADARLRRR